MKLSIVVPAHNEADNIALVITSIEQNVRTPHELIVVNDHSTDQTRSVVEGLIRRYPNLRLVDNLKAACFGNALKTGFKAASGDALVPVMGDLCDELAVIDTMAGRISQGFDIVCGSRYSRG